MGSVLRSHTETHVSLQPSGDSEGSAAAGRRPRELVLPPGPPRGVAAQQAEGSPTGGHASPRTGQCQSLSPEGVL